MNPFLRETFLTTCRQCGQDIVAQVSPWGPEPVKCPWCDYDGFSELEEDEDEEETNPGEGGCPKNDPDSL
jgi:hypothetical protein